MQSSFFSPRRCCCPGGVSCFGSCRANRWFKFWGPSWSWHGGVSKLRSLTSGVRGELEERLGPQSDPGGRVSTAAAS
jgi:hypothetical protein